MGSSGTLRFSWRVSDLLNILLISSFCLNYSIDLYCLKLGTMSNSQGSERQPRRCGLCWHLASRWLWPPCGCLHTHFGIISLLTLALLTAFSSCSLYYSHMYKDTLQCSSRITPKINEHFVLTSWHDMGQEVGYLSQFWRKLVFPGCLFLLWGNLYWEFTLLWSSAKIIALQSSFPMWETVQVTLKDDRGHFLLTP